LLKHGESASGLKTYRRDILDLEREKFDFDDASFIISSTATGGRPLPLFFFTHQDPWIFSI
jgi:hypothetical protein